MDFIPVLTLFVFLTASFPECVCSAAPALRTSPDAQDVFGLTFLITVLSVDPADAEGNLKAENMNVRPEKKVCVPKLFLFAASCPALTHSRLPWSHHLVVLCPGLLSRAQASLNPKQILFILCTGREGMVIKSHAHPALIMFIRHRC